MLGQQIAGPDDGMIEWILYSSIKGNNLIDAIWRSFNQRKLLEKYKSSSALTDKEYAKCFFETLPSLLEYSNWIKKSLEQSDKVESY